MLSDLQARNFRCFEGITVPLVAGFNFFIGANGEGKTSILEAACILLRLQSQRTSSLAPVVRAGTKSFLVRGRFSDHRMELQYGGVRRRLRFDEIEQRQATEYLSLARVVSFANTDIELVRGGSEARRRYLDFAGIQLHPKYRPTLRAYERALRGRNALLKAMPARPGEIAAYNDLLVRHGRELGLLRAGLVNRLAPLAALAHREISSEKDALDVQFFAGNGPDFAAELAASRAQEERLRQTVVGPHRDDIELSIDGMPAQHFASEGQQRTAALALKVAQARLLTGDEATPPLLLLDDIFGELDPDRRNALLRAIPNDSQKLITATSLHWRSTEEEAVVWQLRDRKLVRQD